MVQRQPEKIQRLIALAVGARRSGAWSTGPSVAVAGSCIAVIGVFWYALVMSNGDRMAGGVYFVVGAVALSPAWLGVGGSNAVEVGGLQGHGPITPDVDPHRVAE